MGTDTDTRPTAMQVISEAPVGADWDSNSPDAIIRALVEHGYVIVHPDDVVEHHPADPPLYLLLPQSDLAGYMNGWNACRESIFGESK